MRKVDFNEVRDLVLNVLGIFSGINGELEQIANEVYFKKGCNKLIKKRINNVRKRLYKHEIDLNSKLNRMRKLLELEEELMEQR